MKLALTFLLHVVVLGTQARGTHANAQMFLAGTNEFIGTVKFYMEEEAWGVVISGSVNRLRPLTTVVNHFIWYLSSKCSVYLTAEIVSLSVSLLPLHPQHPHTHPNTSL
jgi:hypothetical protein